MKTAAGAAALLAGCNTSGDTETQSESDDVDMDGVNENLDPQEDGQHEELADTETVEDAIEEYSEHVSDNYDGIEGKELVSLTDTGSYNRQSLKVDVKLDEVFDAADIDIDELNAYEILKSRDMDHFADHVGSTIREDFIDPLLDITGEYASTEHDNDEGYAFFSLRMHSADDTEFGLTVNADTLDEVSNELEQAENENSVVEDLVQEHTGATAPKEMRDGRIFIPEGMRRTVEINGAETEIYIEDVTRDDNGTGWAYVDINNRGEDDDGHILTAEGSNRLVGCSWLEKDEVSINPDPYSDGVWFELDQDSLSEYHGECACDPKNDHLATGQEETYTVGHQETTAEVVAVDESDEALIRIDGELAYIEEGETYNTDNGFSYRAENIFDMEHEEGVVELAVAEDECYE